MKKVDEASGGGNGEDVASRVQRENSRGVQTPGTHPYSLGTSRTREAIVNAVALKTLCEVLWMMEGVVTIR